MTWTAVDCRLLWIFLIINSAAGATTNLLRKEFSQPAFSYGLIFPNFLGCFDFFLNASSLLLVSDVPFLIRRFYTQHLSWQVTHVAGSLTTCQTRESFLFFLNGKIWLPPHNWRLPPVIWDQEKTKNIKKRKNKSLAETCFFPSRWWKRRPGTWLGGDLFYDENGSL